MPISRLKYLAIALLALAVQVSVLAQNPSLPSAGIFTVATADGSLSEFKITDGLKVYTSMGQVVVDDNGETTFFNPDEINSIGVLAVDESSHIGDVTATEAERAGWVIFDLAGNMVARGDTGKPDFSRLAKKQIYIVVMEGRGYKYYPL